MVMPSISTTLEVTPLLTSLVTVTKEKKHKNVDRKSDNKMSNY